MSYSTIILADSPVAYWKLDEVSGTSAADSAGTNTGTYNGTFTLAQAGYGAIDGTAVLLNGTTGYISVPNASAIQLTAPFTLEALVKTSTTSIQSIVEKFSTTPFPGYGLAINPNSNANGVLGFWVGGASWLVTSTNIADGNWHHIAVTLVSTTLSIYIDGLLNTTGTRTPSLTNSNQLTIGRNSSASSNFFNGTIDDVALYNTALSASQIFNHFGAIGDSGAVRITQAPIKVLIQPSDQAVRITQMALKILRLNSGASIIKIPLDGLKNNSNFNGF